MNTRRKTKLVHEGGYVAEVEVEVMDSETGWAPYLSLEDAAGRCPKCAPPRRYQSRIQARARILPDPCHRVSASDRMADQVQRFIWNSAGSALLHRPAKLHGCNSSIVLRDCPVKS